MKTKHLFVIASAALSWLAMTPAGHAIDGNVIPGIACQPTFGSQIGDFDFFENSGIRNIAVANRSVDCPIVRDTDRNTNGTRSVAVRVVSSGGATLTCTLNSRDHFGNFLENASANTTSNTPVALILDVNMSSAGGYYAFFCTLPPNGQVISYRLNEF